MGVDECVGLIAGRIAADSAIPFTTGCSSMIASAFSVMVRGLDCVLRKDFSGDCLMPRNA